ncbi:MULTISPECIES: sodium:solute symporter [Burkholderiaceae]|jgi:SSS family solute:Na+ symporter|uniref:sodium:solute symporter n=1 Tax=Burkholderiaceae TaxID=119060 RepID=UPI0004823577|nr:MULTISPECIES: sodium:solute symporter [Burkholderiaceae]PRF10205.1 sodium:solute symporter [Burkholderia multivorans]USX10758.1 sodium:solute symporter [Paraburkholderia fungorum]
MVGRNLGAIHVAALLVSASCGIAFLLGTGEMAIHSGIAGSLYAVVTAFGMFALGLIAKRLWFAGKPIWEVFGNQYGPVVRKAVALLSLVWMAGVLAAQIHGSVAVLATVGFSTFHSVLATSIALLAISSVDLGVAALLFTFGLLGSNLILLHALVTSGGLPVYLHAWPSFIRGVWTAPPIETLTMASGIGFLVLTGSDYQQFVIAARRPVDAWLGCVFAGIFLIAAGFLPAATVVAALHSGQLSGLTDYAGAIPLIMLHTGGPAGPICLGIVVLAALGSGTAITHAMGSALMDLHPSIRRHELTSKCLITAICSIIAIDGYSIVSTIVSLNAIYISAVGVLFVLDQTGKPAARRCALPMMISGGMSSLLTAVVSWAHIADLPNWMSLTTGLLASVAPLLAWYFICAQLGARS